VTAIGARRHNHNHNIMRTGAASAVRVRCHNDNDDTMTIAGLWSYGDWRHVATGCTALVVNYNNLKNDNVIIIARMWANAQRDGCPAEYRWRPLFNASKFGWGSQLLECRAATLPRRKTR